MTQHPALSRKSRLILKENITQYILAEELK